MRKSKVLAQNFHKYVDTGIKPNYLHFVILYLTNSACQSEISNKVWLIVPHNQVAPPQIASGKSSKTIIFLTNLFD